MDTRSNVANNADTAKPMVAGKITRPIIPEKTKVIRYVVPESALQTPIRGHEIMDVVNRCIGSFPTIVAEVKDILRGVEASVRAFETIQLTEEPDKRTLTIQRRYRLDKDR